MINYDRRNFSVFQLIAALYRQLLYSFVNDRASIYLIMISPFRLILFLGICLYLSG